MYMPRSPAFRFIKNIITLDAYFCTVNLKNISDVVQQSSVILRH